MVPSWGKIRRKGKAIFVLNSCLIVSFLLLLDYYTIKYIFTDHLNWSYTELLVVLLISILISFLFFYYGWNMMERRWLKNGILTIRRLRKDENPPVELLLHADPSVKQIESYINRGECYLAERADNQIIGAYVLLSTKPNTIELVNISVSEEYQGRGIGKQLIMDAINKARIKGYTIIEVGTGNSSIGQLALYQKCGFRITEIEKNFFINYYDEKIYENGIQCIDMIRLQQDL